MLLINVIIITIYRNFTLTHVAERGEGLNRRLVQIGGVLSEAEEGGGRRGSEEGWRAMISMELPAHTTQHGALHLGVGVGVNPGDPAGSALTAIHPHPQDALALHHHNHGAATPGGMHEDSKKKRMFLLTNPFPHILFTRDTIQEPNVGKSRRIFQLVLEFRKYYYYYY